MRALSSPGMAAIASGQVTLALLVEMDLASGPLYVNHSRLNLVLNGTTYYGTHGLGQVSRLANVTGEMPRLQFTLSGSPSDKIALALTEPVQGKPVRVKVALLNSTTGALLDMLTLFSGRLDVMGLSDGTEQAALSVTAESGMRNLTRPSNVMYSHTHQQAIAPGDMAWQYTNDQVDQQIVWPAVSWFKKNK